MVARVKPVLVVSRCLGYEKCLHDGSVESWELAPILAKVADVHGWCPEMDAGLGCPRERLRLVETGEGVRLLDGLSGGDQTDLIQRAAEQFLEGLPPVDGLILQHRSATCAPHGVPVYPQVGRCSPLRRDGQGVAASIACSRYPDAAVETGGRLLNHAIRESFFTIAWATAEFRQNVIPSNRMNELVAFHARYKFVFMAYSTRIKDSLGRIVANHERHPVGEVMKRYQDELHRVFTRRPRPGSHVNVLQHMFGYVSDRLTVRERNHVLESFQRYREGSAPLSSAVALIKNCAARFGETYVGSSRYLDPFPGELRNVEDSGKGRTA